MKEITRTDEEMTTYFVESCKKDIRETHTLLFKFISVREKARDYTLTGSTESVILSCLSELHKLDTLCSKYEQSVKKTGHSPSHSILIGNLICMIADSVSKFKETLTTWHDGLFSDVTADHTEKLDKLLEVTRTDQIAWWQKLSDDMYNVLAVVEYTRQTN